MNRRKFLASLAAAPFALSPLAARAYTNSFNKKGFDRKAFEAAQATGSPVLLHVHATWCETCAAQREVLTKLENDPTYKSFTVFDIDFDKEKDVMRSFGAKSRSTVIVFKGKSETGRLVGDTRQSSIADLMKKAL